MSKINFDSLTSGLAVLIVSWEKCGPCVSQAPIFENLKKEYGERIPIEYGFFSTQELEEEGGEYREILKKLKEDYGAAQRFFPSIYVFKDNQVVNVFHHSRELHFFLKSAHGESL